jgi:peptidoglycan-associated lipoprotein
LAVVAVLVLSACGTPTNQYSGESSSTLHPIAPSPMSAAAVVESVTGRVNDDFIAWVGDRVFFDIDRATLKVKADSRATLNRQVEWLNRYPDTGVRIEGHTDITGTEVHNRALGRRGGHAVQSYLIAHGIEASRITTLSFGKTHPIDSRKSATAFAQNRNAITRRSRE